MRTLQEASISCVAAPDQYAAIAAIEGDQSHVDAAREHYRANFEAVARVLDDRGIRYLRPRGTFYLWVDVGHASGGDVAAWAEQLPATASGSRSLPEARSGARARAGSASAWRRPRPTCSPASGGSRGRADAEPVEAP